MRIELLHPMIVGFPISLLSIGSALRLVAFFARKRPSYGAILMIAQCLLGGGILFGIAAIFTGDLAHAKVHPNICDHSVLDDHQESAFITISLFTAGFLADRAGRWSRGFKCLSIACYFVALFALVNTGHFGGALVFNQGVGVEKLCTGKTKTPLPEHEN